MTGKEKCEKLRAIRRQIAEENHIPYIPEEKDVCTYQGDDCTGTCPKCEQDIRYLEQQLKKRAAAGVPVNIDRIAESQIPFESRPRGFSFDRAPEPGNKLGYMERNPEIHQIRGVARMDPDWENKRKPVSKMNLSLLTKWKLIVRGRFTTAGDLTGITSVELEEKCRLSDRERETVVRALREMGLSMKQVRGNSHNMVAGMMKGPGDW